MGSQADLKTIEIRANGVQASNTIKELAKVTRDLRKELNTLAPTSQEFINKSKRLREVNDRLSELRTGVSKQEMAWMSFKRQAEGVMLGVFGGSVLMAATSGVIRFFGAAAKSAQEYSDRLSDITKLNGLSLEQNKLLYKEISKLPTRTKKSDLMDIAEIAGRNDIGSQFVAKGDFEGARKEILDFVAVMDKATVSLGKEFSGGAEEVATSLGKLKFLFKETRDLGIDKAYNAIGSSLNELDAKSRATAAGITEFSTRVGAYADNVKPAIDQTLALGAVFEESGITAEISSRAYGIFISKAAENIDKFAIAMRMSKKEAADLLNNDPATFFVKFAAGVKTLKNTELQVLMKDLGVSADGADKAIGALANNTDRYFELLKVSSNAYVQSSSLAAEAKLKQENLAGEYEQSTKKLKEQFMPALRATGDALTRFVIFIANNANGLINLIKILSVGTLSWIAYKVATYVATGALRANMVAMLQWMGATKAMLPVQALFGAGMNLLSGNIKNARYQWQIFTASLSANPIGIVVAAIAAVAAGIWLWTKRTLEVTDAQKNQLDINKRMIAAHVEEKTRLQELLKIARDEKNSKADRLAAIKKLNDISPEYLKGLNLENVNTAKGVELLDQYIKMLDKKAFIEATNAKRTELEGKKLEKEMILNSPDGIKDEVSTGDILRAGLFAKSGKKSTDFAKARIEEDKKAIDLQITELNKYIDSKLSAADKVKGLGGVTDGTVGTLEDDEVKKKREKAMEDYKRNTAKMVEDLRKIKVEAIEDEEKREVEKLALTAKLRTEEIAATAADAKVKADLIKAIENNLQGDIAELRKKYGDEKKKTEYEQTVKALNDNYAQERIMLAHDHIAGLSTEKEYNDKLEKLDLDHLQQKLTAAKDYGMDMLELEKQIVEGKIKWTQKELDDFNDKLNQKRNAELARAKMSVRLTREGSEKRLEAEINLLHLQASQELEVFRGTEEEKALIAAEYRDKEAELIRQNWLGNAEYGASIAQGFADKLFSINNQRIANEETLENNKLKKDIKKLDRQLATKQISEEQYTAAKEKLETDSNERMNEIKRDAFASQKAAAIIQATISGILAVMKTYETIPPPFNIPAAILVGALAGAQVATIANQPTPEFARGTVVDGRGTVLEGASHNNGGVPLYGKDGYQFGEAEGDEILMTKGVYRSPEGRRIASDLNERYGGVRFDGRSATPMVKFEGWNSMVTPPRFEFGSVINAGGYRSTRTGGGGDDGTLGTLRTNNTSVVDFEERISRYEDFLREMAREIKVIKETKMEAYINYDVKKRQEEDLARIQNR